jgi:hypothetical protein
VLPKRVGLVGRGWRTAQTARALSNELGGGLGVGVMLRRYCNGSRFAYAAY